MQKDQSDTTSFRPGSTEGRGRRKRSMSGSSTDKRILPPQEPDQGGSASNYFSMESFLMLIFLTMSLLILPLVLPPLPPPPSMLLLLPLGILALLMILAFMPPDIRNIASSYL